MPDLRHKYGHFWFKCLSKDHYLAQNTGFEWNRARCLWVTKNPAIAQKLIRYADFETKKSIRIAMATLTDAIAKSRAVTSTINPPVPAGLAYRSYQKAAVAFALGRPNVLLADEMGLGKTIQAIAIINMDASINTVLIICPASIKINWHRELSKWLIRYYSIVVVNSTDPWPTAAEIVIINYDILHRFKEKITIQKWDALIVDECHYAKNPDSKRAQMIIGNHLRKISPICAHRKIFLGGTPLENRPIEGWGIFNYLAPTVFRSFWHYAKRYCNAYQGKYGWDMTGASHLDELQQKLRSSIMIRRLKSEVLAELPPKVRQIIELPRNGFEGLLEKELMLWRKHTTADPHQNYNRFVEEVFKLLCAPNLRFDDISCLRHECALAKAPAVADFTLNALATAAKVVVFAHHHDVIDLLAQKFHQAKIPIVIVTGKTPLKKRQMFVDAFQQDSHVRIFIGNIQAAGVGLTLTAASQVIFAELDWVPGKVIQAEDRCHRIGQIDSVLVQHLVVNGSIDVNLIQTLIQKQQILDAALNARK